MIELMAAAPLGGLDVTHGALRLRQAEVGQITWLAPWPGREREMSHALQAVHGMHFPAPGEVQGVGGARLLWSGRAQALLLARPPAPALAEHGAVVDQSDGWAVLDLRGDGAGDALARLVPLDLRRAVFGPGRTARSLLGQMNAQITPVNGGLEIMVMRSMARTAARQVGEAMRSVAARAAG